MDCGSIPPMPSSARNRAPALLIAARKSRGWTQRKMAVFLGCHPSMVAQMERGLSRPGRTLSNRIEALLDIPTSVWDLPSDLRAREPQQATAGGAR